MDDLLSNTEVNSLISTRRRSLSRAISLEIPSTFRPVGIAEPLRRLSSGFIRAFKPTDHEEYKSLDKSVQVCTIIRRCGRCAETHLPIRPVRMHSAISSSSSSMAEELSSCDDDDVMDMPPPNFDRIRQRRATLVAKTILNQLATQPRSSSIEDLITPITFPTNQRKKKPGDSLSIPVKCSVNVSTSPQKRNSQEEFTALSRQISALLVPSDDENEAN